MNIAIIGLGKFGKELTENLSFAKHNITVVDTKAQIIEEMVNQYDVIGYVGNGASYQTQINASLNKADVLIATTSTDETNILCCLVAKKLGIKHTIARIRNPEYAIQTQFMSEELGIDVTLNPDLDTAHEIFRILRFPSAIKSEAFANGKVDMVEIKIDKDSLLCNKSLVEIAEKYQVRILVCAVKRDNDVFIPKGDFVLQEGDYVYLTCDAKEISKAFRKLKIYKEKLSSAMIVGGGKITYYLASLLLKNGISVKIVEKDKQICKTLSDLFPKAIVLNGDATNQKLLLEEGIESIDSVITLTGMDETNIVISSFAHNLNCDKVITKVNNTNYDLILKNVGLDSVISPKDIFASNILKYVRGMENSSKRGSEITTLHRLVNNKVEALEFTIPKQTKYTSIPLKDLSIKSDTLLACIIRNNSVIIPNGKDTIEPLDSVIIITTNTKIKDFSDILE